MASAIEAIISDVRALRGRVSTDLVAEQGRLAGDNWLTESAKRGDLADADVGIGADDSAAEADRQLALPQDEISEREVGVAGRWLGVPRPRAVTEPDRSVSGETPASIGAVAPIRSAGV
jgi:hypothetical protein